MSDYVLGHSPPELVRLSDQARLLDPITERMLRSAGLKPGMRVLDVGCGSGDVSLLAASIVGEAGCVIGVDRAPQAVRHATERIARMSVQNVIFQHGTAADISGDMIFDFAVGRYVLCYQDDPTAFMREIAARVRPHGIVAFHDYDMVRDCPGTLAVPRFDQVWGEMIRGLKASAASPDVAVRLAFHFEQAGLRLKGGFCERPVGMAGAKSFFRWVAGSYVAVRPDREVGDEQARIAALAEELESAVHIAGVQVVGDDQWCARAEV